MARVTTTQLPALRSTASASFDRLRLWSVPPRVGGLTLPPLPVAAAILAVALANGFYLVGSATAFGASPLWPDWRMMARAASDVRAGVDPYAGSLYLWSPVMAWIIGPLMAAGPLVWQAALIASTFLIPDRRLRLLVLVSWPFWYDVFSGNLMIFVAVAALLAVRGSRLATWGFLALTLLIPRPLMMPVVAWLLWQRRELRLWFALMAAGYLALVAISGLGPEFLAKLTTTSGLVDFGTNVSPSRLIGLWWVPIGVALSVWLTLRGRLGWAALAFSPYLLPNYLLMLVLEWPIQRPMPLRRRLSNRLRERRGPTTG